MSFPAALFYLLVLAASLFAGNVFATELTDDELIDNQPPAGPAEILVAEPVTENGDTQSQQSLTLLQGSIAPGEFNTLYWSPEQSFSSIDTPVPVLVAHGNHPGPRLCVTAAIHGDELNGIEIVRRLMFQLAPETLNGTVIGIPIVNLDGFRRSSRYLADRRDLNRHFPGSPRGSAADRIAYSLFDDVIHHCNLLVDLHTGSQQRTNLPQIRGNLKDTDIFNFSRQFGGITVLHGVAPRGTLRRAANDIGIPAVTMEAGGPHQLSESAVDTGVKSLETLLQNLGMQKTRRFWGSPQPVFYESRWVRANQGGILMSEVKLGSKVSEGQILGNVIDPISNTGSAILAPFDGRVLGMAVNQVVQTGFAAYHLGVERPAEQVQGQIDAGDPAPNDTPACGDEPCP